MLTKQRKGLYELYSPIWKLNRRNCFIKAGYFQGQNKTNLFD